MHEPLTHMYLLLLIDTSVWNLNIMIDVIIGVIISVLNHSHARYAVTSYLPNTVKALHISMTS